METTRCCYILERARQESAGLGDSIASIIDKVASKMLEAMVIGETVNMEATNGAYLKLMK